MISRITEDGQWISEEPDQVQAAFLRINGVCSDLLKEHKKVLKLGCDLFDQMVVADTVPSWLSEALFQDSPL